MGPQEMIDRTQRWVLIVQHRRAADLLEEIATQQLTRSERDLRAPYTQADAITFNAAGLREEADRLEHQELLAQMERDLTVVAGVWSPGTLTEAARLMVEDYGWKSRNPPEEGMSF